MCFVKNEYDQEIIQSYTTGKPMPLWGKQRPLTATEQQSEAAF